MNEKSKIEEKDRLALKRNNLDPGSFFSILFEVRIFEPDPFPQPLLPP
jgi:hypothetical protein